MTRPAPIIAGILAALLLLFGAYMGAYYGMLAGLEPTGPWSPPGPRYRTSHEMVRVILRPAHRLDRKLRPNTWHDGH